VLASQTLDRIGTAIGTLSTASQNNSERLKDDRHEGADQQSRTLTQMIGEAESPLLMLFVVTVILALAAIAGTVSFVVMSAQDDETGVISAGGDDDRDDAPWFSRAPTG